MRARIRTLARLVDGGIIRRLRTVLRAQTPPQNVIYSMRRPTMQSCKTETSLSVLGGAMLGAAVMYLLDPDSGRRRRERLADATGGALHTTGDALSHAWEHARDAGAALG